METSSDLPTIPEFYRGRKIFITGGSGFMGKVLVEKLLRSCPDIDTIYLLLRPKKGKEPSSRVKDITDVPLFDKIKQERPSNLSKLVAVSGDVTQVGLGLSEEDRLLLQKEVSVIFHTAASVRFDEPIRDAILINVRGTREVIHLALGMENLKVFQHLSTAFSNFHRAETVEQVREEIYSPVGDWRRMIQLAEQQDNDHVLRMLTPKILGTLPNTYTYAKNLAEHLVNDYRDQLPLVIVRPSVVSSAVEEPMPGWMDNFNGPVVYWMGVISGVIRTTLVSGQICNDYVPVDKAIKSMIFVAWHRALTRPAPTTLVTLSSPAPPTPVALYNCCTLLALKTHEAISEPGIQVLLKFPVSQMVWYPVKRLTYSTNWIVFYIRFMLFQFVPALVFDLLLKVKGKKPVMAKLQRKIYVANVTSYIFTSKQTNFCNKRILALETSMRPEDKEAFSYATIEQFDEKYTLNIILGARQYLLKEPLTTLPHSRSKLKRMYWMDWIVKTLLVLSLLWAVTACPHTRTAMVYAHSMV